MGILRITLQMMLKHINSTSQELSTGVNDRAILILFVQWQCQLT